MPPAAPAPGVSRSSRPVAERRPSAKSCQGGVQLGDLRRRRALLGAVCRRGAGRSEERVRDVRGDPQVDRREALVEAREIDARFADHRAEAAQDAGPAVGRRAAPDAEGDRSDARVEHGSQDLARPPRRGPDRISLRGREPRQPGRLGELDHRSLAILGAQPARLHRPPDRVGGVNCAPRPAPGRGDGDERHLAAVGERCHDELVVRSLGCASRRRGPSRPRRRSASP